VDHQRGLRRHVEEVRECNDRNPVALAGAMPPRTDRSRTDRSRTIPSHPGPHESYWYEPSPDPYGTAAWPEHGSNGPVDAGPGPNGGRPKRQRGRGRI